MQQIEIVKDTVTVTDELIRVYKVDTLDKLKSVLDWFDNRESNNNKIDFDQLIENETKSTLENITHDFIDYAALVESLHREIKDEYYDDYKQAEKINALITYESLYEYIDNNFNSVLKTTYSYFAPKFTYGIGAIGEFEFDTQFIIENVDNLDDFVINYDCAYTTAPNIYLDLSQFIFDLTHDIGGNHAAC